MIFHTLDVTSRNLLTELVVYYSDTDVLLLLLHYFDDTGSSTIFRSTSRDIHVRSMHTHFWFCTHTMQTGRFCGYDKPSCWKVLMNASKKVSNSLRSLGEHDITDDFKNMLEKFVLDLYYKKKQFTYVGIYFPGNFPEEILAWRM